MSLNNRIEWILHNESFIIPKEGFRTQNTAKKLIEQVFERWRKTTQHTIKRDFAQLNVKLNEFESTKREHVNNLKEKIELHKETLKKQIEIIPNEMIHKLVKLNEDFLD